MPLYELLIEAIDSQIDGKTKTNILFIMFSLCAGYQEEFSSVYSFAVLLFSLFILQSYLRF